MSEDTPTVYYASEMRYPKGGYNHFLSIWLILILNLTKKLLNRQ